MSYTPAAPGTLAGKPEEIMDYIARVLQGISPALDANTKYRFNGTAFAGRCLVSISSDGTNYFTLGAFGSDAYVGQDPANSLNIIVSDAAQRTLSIDWENRIDWAGMSITAPTTRDEAITSLLTNFFFDAGLSGWKIGEVKWLSYQIAEEDPEYNRVSICDGSLYSPTTYARLYAKIGTTYGGGGGNFRIPNALGRTLVCIGTAGETTRELGDAFGAETVTLAAGNMPVSGTGARDSSSPVGAILTAQITDVYTSEVETSAPTPFDISQPSLTLIAYIRIL